MEKAARLKLADNRIVTLKREINKLKDILAEYGTYQGFLTSLSPDSWKSKQVGRGGVKSRSSTNNDDEMVDALMSPEMRKVLQQLGMTIEEIGIELIIIINYAPAAIWR